MASMLGILAAGSLGFGYQSESILKDDCLRAVSHGRALSEGLRGALELECSLMEGLENEEGGEERKIQGGGRDGPIVVPRNALDRDTGVLVLCP